MALRSTKYEIKADKEEKAPRARNSNVPSPPEENPRVGAKHSMGEATNNHLSGWEMEDFDVDTLTPKSSGDLLMVSIKVKRNPFGVVMILVVPLVICIILSMASFVLSSDNLSDRLQITVTMLLAAAAFHQQARGHIPPNLPYTTVLDKYMLTTLVILLVQAFVHVLISSVKDSESGGTLTSGVDTLFLCHCITDPSGVGCQKPIATRSRMHRFTYSLIVVFLVIVHYVYRRAGSLRKIASSVAKTAFRLIKTISVWLAGAVGIFLIMTFGVHPELLVSCFSVSGVVANVQALFLCLEGHCVGVENPALCSPPVLTVLQWILNDETLVEFMVYSIIIVHLVLWVEYLL